MAEEGTIIEEASLDQETQARSALRDLAGALKLYAANSSQFFVEDLDSELLASLGFLGDLPKSAPKVRRQSLIQTQTQTQNTGQPEPQSQAQNQNLTQATAQPLNQILDSQGLKPQGFTPNPVVAKADLAPETQPAENQTRTLDPLAAKSLDSLHLRIKNCLDCDLGHARVNLIFGQGNQEADLLFIGEAPTAEEDRSGSIYNSPTGRLLSQIITSIGISRESVYFCNTLKCKVPEGAKPTVTEIKACSGILGKQIALLKPKLIVTLGNVATKALIPNAGPISKIRGTEQVYQGIMVIPTFHPNYLTHTHTHLPQMWDDMRIIRQKLFMS
ncbi:MAG: uracil-DNA glycosylase [SAR324 cluster bacterium]|nr:uracil-DNA glycosylase [SAR324 cluster bacterium]